MLGESYVFTRCCNGMDSGLSWSCGLMRMGRGTPPTRYGTNLDVAKIQEVFGNTCEFTVETYHNKKKDEICKVLGDLGKREDLSCLVIFFLSHGDSNDNLSAFDQDVSINKTIIPSILPRSCPHLAGRAKMVRFYSSAKKCIILRLLPLLRDMQLITYVFR